MLGAGFHLLIFPLSQQANPKGRSGASKADISPLMFFQCDLLGCNGSSGDTFGGIGLPRKPRHLTSGGENTYDNWGCPKGGPFKRVDQHTSPNYPGPPPSLFGKAAPQNRRVPPSKRSCVFQGQAKASQPFIGVPYFRTNAIKLASNEDLSRRMLFFLGSAVDSCTVLFLFLRDTSRRVIAPVVRGKGQPNQTQMAPGTTGCGKRSARRSWSRQAERNARQF